MPPAMFTPFFVALVGEGMLATALAGVTSSLLINMALSGIPRTLMPRRRR